jgi:hypothetical protein
MGPGMLTVTAFLEAQATTCGGKGYTSVSVGIEGSYEIGKTIGPNSPSKPKRVPKNGYEFTAQQASAGCAICSTDPKGVVTISVTGKVGAGYGVNAQGQLQLDVGAELTSESIKNGLSGSISQGWIGTFGASIELSVTGSYYQMIKM